MAKGEQIDSVTFLHFVWFVREFNTVCTERTEIGVKKHGRQIEIRGTYESILYRLTAVE